MLRCEFCTEFLTYLLVIQGGGQSKTAVSRPNHSTKKIKTTSGLISDAGCLINDSLIHVKAEKFPK